MIDVIEVNDAYKLNIEENHFLNFRGNKHYAFFSNNHKKLISQLGNK